MLITRQEVFYFGAPSGDASLAEGRMPVWVDLGPRFMYGIPGNLGQGFKLADDTRGPQFDPTSGERVPTAEGTRAVREYLAMRFPAMHDAPLLEARVCQYENSTDQHFVLDRHPAAQNLWLAAGGSGHGFKHGPGVGEMLSQMILGEREPEPQFQLARFAKSGSGA
jgi:glycine/D-amino acid oxidase-like deaminating enzyme